TELSKLIAYWLLLWPNAKLPEDHTELATAARGRILTDATYEEARWVLEALSRSGAKFAPNPGELAAAVARERSSALSGPVPD
ncbi:hypothetical protein, partial [Streptococcus pseudopneumoniae]|uniref:hypothetical protein n=1 Tax=Streptococcus pseudopneumoniae TaxID=257758 RepID=UPI0019D5F8EB